MDFASSRTRLRLLFNRSVESPSVALLSRLGVTPNQLTLLGLALAGAAAYLLATGRLVAAAVLLLGSGLLDLLDGALARRTSRASPFGAVLDSVSDRIGEGAAFLGLLLWYLDRANSVGIALCYVAAVTSFLVSYARARAEGVGANGAVGFAGRAERIVILSIGLIVGYPTVALGVISTLATITFLHRIFHIWRTVRRDTNRYRDR